jgi:hypothetical protein
VQRNMLSIEKDVLSPVATGSENVFCFVLVREPERSIPLPSYSRQPRPHQPSLFVELRS